MAALMTKAVTASQGLAQFEPLVMSQLFWADQPKLQGVHAEDDAVVTLRDRVRGNWARAITPVLEYRALFGKFAAILRRDNEAYVAALADSGVEPSLDDVRRELDAAKDALQALHSDIPAKVRQRTLYADSTAHAQHL